MTASHIYTYFNHLKTRYCSPDFFSLQQGTDRTFSLVEKPNNCDNNHQRCIDPVFMCGRSRYLNYHSGMPRSQASLLYLRGKQKRVEGVKQVKWVGTRFTNHCVELERFLQYQCFTYMYDLIYHHWSLDR